MAQKGTNAAVVGGNNNEIIALDGIDSIIGRRYEDHPQYGILVVALKSRSYGGNLTKKKEQVLKLFRLSELGVAGVAKYCRDFWPRYGTHIFESIRINTTTESQINKLNAAFIADRLCELHVLGDWIKELPPQQGRRLRDDPTTKTTKAFALLTDFIGPVLQKYKEDELKVSKKNSRSKANLQATGMRIQDKKPFDINYCDSEECPNPDCKHFYCLPITTMAEVAAKQKDLDDKFGRKMQEWTSKPLASRGGKPRRQKSVAMELACYCVKVSCGLRLDGGNCPACTAAAATDESMVYIGGDGKSHCRCEICNCKCQVKFGLNERRNIAFEMEQKKRATEGSSSSSTPTDTPSYFNQIIRETVQQSTIDAMQEPSSNDPTMVHQNALSLAAGSVLANPSLQSILLRNNMQQQLSRTTMTSTGLSIGQVRKRQKAGISVRLPMDVTPTTSGSALAMTDIEREQRFISNRLSAQPIVPPTVAAAARPARSSNSISTLDDDSNEIVIVEDLDKKPKATSPRKRSPPKESTPQIVKTARKELNLALRNENKKKENKDSELITKIKTARESLSSERLTKEDNQYFVDNESGYEGSEDILEDTICFFN